ncbi:unnamed protein product [Sphagnum balticum]
MGAALRHPGQITHPNHVVLRPPVNVSPFIRVSVCASFDVTCFVTAQFCRWAALGTGIMYGWYRYSQLKAIHVEVRDYEHRQQMAEEHKQHKIKGWKAREDMENLAREVGLPWTPELQKQLGLVEEGHGHH